MTDNARPTVTILGGRHQLTLHGVTRAEDSFAVTYSITPPLPEGPDDESPILLALEAEDDLGNEYTDWGGAFGLAADGTRTEGHSLWPASAAHRAAHAARAVHVPAGCRGVPLRLAPARLRH
uniref:Uncharacterized protein n=1 Tax=Streptomyces sp. NBC_00003 TaxID=2903608 RepID=A0AAU2V0L6_9ACTN